MRPRTTESRGGGDDATKRKGGGAFRPFASSDGGVAAFCGPETEGEKEKGNNKSPANGIWTQLFFVASFVLFMFAQSPVRSDVCY